MNKAVNYWMDSVKRQRLNPVIKGEYRSISSLVTQEEGKLICPYCSDIYFGMGGLLQHIRFRHGLSSKSVYDSLCKRSTDGLCIICGNPTIFKCGRYLLTCSKECKAKWVSKDELRARKISANRRKYSTESFIEKARIIHGDRFDYKLTDIGLLRDRVDIICKKHGLFNTVACYHLEDMYGGCRKCASESMVLTKAAWTDEKKEKVNNIRRKTNLDRFGNKAGPNPFGSDAFIDIMLEKYGVENPFCSDEIKEKIKETNLAKYGVTNPAYLEKTIKASHTKQANRKRYLVSAQQIDVRMLAQN